MLLPGRIAWTLLAVAWVATATSVSATNSRSETVLISWRPDATNGLTGQSDGTSLLSWWLGFGTANITESGSGTTFSQNPYTATLPPGPATPTSAPGTLDHVKFLALTAPINISAGRKLVFSARVGAQAAIPAKLPYKVYNAQDDLRLGSCSLNFIDFSIMLVADTFLTNTGIWALYERLPFARTATYDYAAFTYVRRIGSRTSSSQVHDLQIKYNAARSELQWWVDGKMKHKVGRLGYRPSGMRALMDLGGEEELVAPSSFSLGFGCFTLLDGAEPGGPAVPTAATTGLLNLNPTAPDSPREVYRVPRSWQADTRGNSSSAAAAAGDVGLRLFGQGASMSLSAFKVSYQ